MRLTRRPDEPDDSGPPDGPAARRLPSPSDRHPPSPDEGPTRGRDAQPAAIPPSMAPDAVPVRVDLSVAGEEDPGAGIDSPDHA